MTEAQNIDIYTDGSCINQGYTNAQAAFAVFFGDNDPRNISQKLSSKREQDVLVAELEAIRHALISILKELNHPKNQDRKMAFTIYSDSTSAIEWVTGFHSPRRNMASTVDSCRYYYSQVKARTSLSILHVDAHTNVHGNERADNMAYLEACTYI